MSLLRQAVGFMGSHLFSRTAGLKRGQAFVMGIITINELSSNLQIDP